MTTIFAYIESAPDTPLTGASPAITFWNKASPGAPLATGAAMTELVGGSGGVYFADVSTTDGLEYGGVVDGTAAAKAGSRYQLVSFSGTTDARLEVDIPAILASVESTADEIDNLWFWNILSLILGLFTLWRTSEVWRILGLDRGNPVVNDTGSRVAPSDGSAIDQTVSTDGAEVTVTREL